MKRFLLVHYGEIGLKGENAPYFVKKLQKRIRMKLEKKFARNFSVKYMLGRLMIEMPEDFEEKEYSAIIKRIFGIQNFLFMYEGSTDLDKLGKQILKNLPNHFLKKHPENFCVRVKRSMNLPFTSEKAERDLGAYLIENGFDVKVKLKGAELIIWVEFFSDHAYFSFEKYQGTGGLPGNSQSKLCSMISAGIDSPVASYLMMRRGARIIFVHFHSYPFSEQSEINHVKKLVEMLSEYQADTKLYMIPFGKIQKEISLSKDVPAKYRVIIYRRMMFRVVEEIAAKNKAKGIITGESLGQVASQTAENIFAIHGATKMPIYQPLIAFDKEDTVKLAEEIGTFEISKLPCTDTCTMFTPQHPEIKGNPRDAAEYEKKLPVEKWTKELFDLAEVIYFD